jgi:hypothetical protein
MKQQESHIERFDCQNHLENHSNILFVGDQGGRTVVRCFTELWLVQNRRNVSIKILITL